MPSPSPPPPKIHLSESEKHALILTIAPFEYILARPAGETIDIEGTPQRVSLELKRCYWDKIRMDFIGRYPRLMDLSISQMKVLWARYKRLAANMLDEGSPITTSERTILSITRPQDLKARGITPLELDGTKVDTEKIRFTTEEHLTLVACVSQFFRLLTATPEQQVVFKGEWLTGTNLMKNLIWEDIRGIMVRFHPRVFKVPAASLKIKWWNIRAKALRDLDKEDGLTQVDIAALTVLKPDELTNRGIPLATLKDITSDTHIIVGGENGDSGAESSSQHLIYNFENNVKPEIPEEEVIIEGQFGGNGDDVFEEDDFIDDDVGIPSTSNNRGKVTVISGPRVKLQPPREFTEEDIQKAKASTTLLDIALKMTQLDEYSKTHKRKIVFNKDYSITFRKQRKGEDLNVEFPAFLTNNK
ncbi:unnamed protein product [Bursaphelenchus xylophilus]|uniref:(pine wood nematode) hypothetical protein n=1 Tax=Bursaphelenchus xylophilus TaxID=6326 RepID=A0A1I7RQG2_BURXY|nr:unnamed protein product [Bursaphelenchus xylophilus]CAG9104519.1 unnamed protein product [Bursaphelenchus xylophilus]